MKKFLFSLFILQLFVGKISAQVNMNLSLDDFNNSIQSEHEKFTDEQIKEYTEFRDKINAEYADFMEKLWKAL